MAERFSEDILQQILNSANAAEARIENGAPIIEAFNWLREELVGVKEGEPYLYEIIP